MGFPEVILPNDVRNDLYVTLIEGAFQRGSKKSDKNVEVTVSAHNEQGRIIKVSPFRITVDHYSFQNDSSKYVIIVSDRI